MVKALPPLPPDVAAKVKQVQEGCAELLDRYLNGFELDMNRFVVKHGPMDEARVHNDLTRILARDVSPIMLAGLTAEAILRGIARKRKGKG